MPIKYSLELLEGKGVSVLRIIGDLDFESRKKFQHATQELLKSPEKKLVIDLSAISRISSIFLGSLVDVSLKTKKMNKSLSIIVVAKVERAFRESNLAMVATIIVKKRQPI